MSAAPASCSRGFSVATVKLASAAPATVPHTCRPQLCRHRRRPAHAAGAPASRCPARSISAGAPAQRWRRLALAATARQEFLPATVLRLHYRSYRRHCRHHRYRQRRCHHLHRHRCRHRRPHRYRRRPGRLACAAGAASHKSTARTLSSKRFGGWVVNRATAKGSRSPTRTATAPVATASTSRRHFRHCRNLHPPHPHPRPTPMRRPSMGAAACRQSSAMSARSRRLSPMSR